MATIPAMVRRFDRASGMEEVARDVLITDLTGSGKTLAYLLPILSEIDVYRDGQSDAQFRGAVQAVIVVPSRELAVQVALVAHTTATLTVGKKKRRSHPTRVQAVVGEVNPAMIRALNETQPHIVVSTPNVISVRTQHDTHGTAADACLLLALCRE
jgi:superfamily II DNA/RNA helicase